MATINGRRVRFTDPDGVSREGVVSGWREGSQWIKVRVPEFPEPFMVHDSERVEVIGFDVMPTSMHEDDEGGLSKFGRRVLGFNEMCQCGHEDGMHMTPGMECAVLDCKCARFQNSQSSAVQSER